MTAVRYIIESILNVLQAPSGILENVLLAGGFQFHVSVEATVLFTDPTSKLLVDIFKQFVAFSLTWLNETIEIEKVVEWMIGGVTTADSYATAGCNSLKAHKAAIAKKMTYLKDSVKLFLLVVFKVDCSVVLDYFSASPRLEK